MHLVHDSISSTEYCSLHTLGALINSSYIHDWAPGTWSWKRLQRLCLRHRWSPGVQRDSVVAVVVRQDGGLGPGRLPPQPSRWGRSSVWASWASGR